MGPQPRPTGRDWREERNTFGLDRRQVDNVDGLEVKTALYPCRYSCRGEI